MFARPPLRFRQIRLRAASGSNESYAKMFVEGNMTKRRSGDGAPLSL
jgi:hypothetical protein